MRRISIRFTVGIAVGAVFSLCSAIVTPGQTTFPRALKVSKLIPAVSPTNAGPQIHRGVRCDARGNLYIQPVTSRLAQLSVADPVEEIKADGSQGPEFSLRSISGPQKYDLELNSAGLMKTSIDDFAVGPHGRVYFAVRRCGQPSPTCSIEIVQFDSNGQEQAITRLDYTGVATFIPQHLVVLPDGRFFIGGMLEGPGRPIEWYAGIYDSDGKLHAAVKDLPDDVKPQPPAPGTMTDMAYLHDVSLTMAVGSGEGSVYLIRPLEHPILYVVSEDGAILHYSQVPPPFQNAVPFGMKNAGNGRAIIQFARKIAGGITMSGNFLSLVDASTGHTLGNYTADRETGGLFGCFEPETGFAFLSPWDKAGSWFIHVDSPQ